MRNAFNREDGQVVILYCICFTALLGFTGLVVDSGRTYIAYRQLQTSTDAAALAGAQQLPDTTTAVSTATTFSGTGTNTNAFPTLPGVSFVSGYPKVRCLTSLQAIGQACIPNATAGGNALQVRQQVTMPLFIGSLFGVPSITLSSSATASMRGSSSIPYNVAIVLDTTASMGSNKDSNCGNVTRIACALQGVQTLMMNMSPCASSYSTCSFSSNVASNAVDQVSLFTFPNVYVSQTINSSTQGKMCNGYGTGTLPVYSFPSSSATSYTALGVAAKSQSTTPTYQLTPFWSDYRSSDTASSLNTSSTSYLVQDVGGTSGCTGLSTPGGDGTYYAGAIYAAQAALTAQAAANPGSQNVLIFLSDGDASSTKFDTSATGFSTTSGVYPSSKNQCAQAVAAAAAAASAGTRVYTVAYGSATSGACSTDTGTYAGSSCLTMEKMASNSLYFFSADYNKTASCQSAAQPTSNMSQIFTQIAGGLTTSRLIPDTSS
jgi:hypothetical protein